MRYEDDGAGHSGPAWARALDGRRAHASVVALRPRQRQRRGAWHRPVLRFSFRRVFSATATRHRRAVVERRPAERADDVGRPRRGDAIQRNDHKSVLQYSWPHGSLTGSSRDFAAAGALVGVVELDVVELAHDGVGHPIASPRKPARTAPRAARATLRGHGRELLAFRVVERLFGGQADALQALLLGTPVGLRLRRDAWDVRRRRFGGGLRRFVRGGRGGRAAAAAALVAQRRLRPRAVVGRRRGPNEAFEIPRAGGARRRGTSPRRFLPLGQPSVGER